MRKAMTLIAAVPPNATLRSDGALPSCVRIGPISLPAVPDPRKSEPVMLMIWSFWPPISEGNIASSSVSAVNDGRAKLRPGSPKEAPGSPVVVGTPVADVDPPVVGAPVAALPLHAATMKARPANRVSAVPVRRAVMGRAPPRSQRSKCAAFAAERIVRVGSHPRSRRPEQGERRPEGVRVLVAQGVEHDDDLMEPGPSSPFEGPEGVVCTQPHRTVDVLLVRHPVAGRAVRLVHDGEDHTLRDRRGVDPGRSSGRTQLRSE